MHHRHTRQQSREEYYERDRREVVVNEGRDSPRHERRHILDQYIRPEYRERLNVGDLMCGDDYNWSQEDEFPNTKSPNRHNYSPDRSEPYTYHNDRRSPEQYGFSPRMHSPNRYGRSHVYDSRDRIYDGRDSKSPDRLGPSSRSPDRYGPNSRSPRTYNDFFHSPERYDKSRRSWSPDQMDSLRKTRSPDRFYNDLTPERFPSNKYNHRSRRPNQFSNRQNNQSNSRRSPDRFYNDLSPERFPSNQYDRRSISPKQFSHRQHKQSDSRRGRWRGNRRHNQRNTHARETLVNPERHNDQYEQDEDHLHHEKDNIGRNCRTPDWECEDDEIIYNHNNDSHHSFHTEEYEGNDSPISYVTCDDLSSVEGSPKMYYNDQDEMGSTTRSQRSEKDYRYDTRTTLDKSRSGFSDRSRSRMSDRSKSRERNSRCSSRSSVRMRGADHSRSPGNFDRSRSPQTEISRDSENRRQSNRSKSPTGKRECAYRHDIASPDRRIDSRSTISRDRTVKSSERTSRNILSRSSDHQKKSEISRHSREREDKKRQQSDEETEDVKSPIDEIDPSYLKSMNMVKTVGLGFQTTKWELIGPNPQLNTLLTPARIPDMKQMRQPLPSKPPFSAPVTQDIIRPPNSQTSNKNLCPSSQFNPLQNIGPNAQNIGQFSKNMPNNTQFKTSQSFVFGKPPSSIQEAQNIQMNTAMKALITQNFVYGRPPNVQQVTRQIQPGSQVPANTFRPRVPQLNTVRPPVAQMNSVAPQAIQSSLPPVSRFNSQFSQGTTPAVSVFQGSTNTQQTQGKHSTDTEVLQKNRPKPLPVRFVVKTAASAQKTGKQPTDQQVASEFKTKHDSDEDEVSDVADINCTKQDGISKDISKVDNCQNSTFRIKQNKTSSANVRDNSGKNANKTIIEEKQIKKPSPDDKSRQHSSDINRKGFNERQPSRRIEGREKAAKSTDMKSSNTENQMLNSQNKAMEYKQSDSLSDFTNKFILQCQGKKMGNSDQRHSDPTSDMADKFILECKNKASSSREDQQFADVNVGENQEWYHRKISVSAGEQSSGSHVRKSSENIHITVSNDRAPSLYSPSRPNTDDLSLLDGERKNYDNSVEGLRITVSNQRIENLTNDRKEQNLMEEEEQNLSPSDRHDVKIADGNDDQQDGGVEDHDNIPMEEEPSLTCRIKRPSTCPIPECQFIAWRLKRHAFSKHIPWLFREDKWCENIPGCGAAIRQLVIWIVGARAKPDELVKLVNESELMPKNIEINSNCFVHMTQLCKDQDWPVQERYTLNPVNSPACLVHWRAMLLLLIYISETRREKFKEMFNKSFVDNANIKTTELAKQNDSLKSFGLKRTKDDTQKRGKSPVTKKSRIEDSESRRNKDWTSGRSRSPAYRSSCRSSRDPDYSRSRNRSPHSKSVSDKLSSLNSEYASKKTLRSDSKRCNNSSINTGGQFHGQNKPIQDSGKALLENSVKSTLLELQDSLKFTSNQQQKKSALQQSMGSSLDQQIRSNQVQLTNPALSSKPDSDQKKRTMQERQMLSSLDTSTKASLNQQMKFLDDSIRKTFNEPVQSTSSHRPTSGKQNLTTYEKRRRRSPVDEQKRSSCDKLVKSTVDQNKRSALVQSMRSFLNKPLESVLEQEKKSKSSSEMSESRSDVSRSKTLTKQGTSESSLEQSMLKTLEELKKSSLPESVRTVLEASMRTTLDQLNKSKLEELNKVEETMLCSLEKMKETTEKERHKSEDVKRAELEASMKSTLEQFCSLLDASSAKMSKKSQYPPKVDSVSKTYSETLYSKRSDQKAGCDQETPSVNKTKLSESPVKRKLSESPVKRKLSESPVRRKLSESPVKKKIGIVEYAPSLSDDEESVIEILDSPSPPQKSYSPTSWEGGKKDISKRKIRGHKSSDYEMQKSNRFIGGEETSSTLEKPYVKDWNHKSPWRHLQETLSELSKHVPQTKDWNNKLKAETEIPHVSAGPKTRAEMWKTVKNTGRSIESCKENKKTSEWKHSGHEDIQKDKYRSCRGAPQGYGPPPVGGYGAPQPGYPAPPPQQLYGGVGFSGPPPGIDPNIYQWFMTVDQDKSGHITAHELQQALVNGNWTHFNPETCRLMISMFDRDNTGTIQLHEFQGLWNYIQQWKGVFERFDGNKSGSIEAYELQQAYQQMGYNLSPQFCGIVIAKFDVHGRRSLTLDNFIQSCVMLKSLTDSFKQRDPQMQGNIRMSYEDFMTTAVFNKI